MHVALGVVLGAALVIVGIHIGNGAWESEEEKEKALQAQYYASEVATLVSPHSLRGRMDKGDKSYILVDTRAKEDYEREHIVGAINIDSAESLENVLEQYQALDHNKEVIIYCYSSSCMNGRKVGNYLAENGVFVKELTIGWNEWRYDWTGWNYDTEWDSTNVEDYVVAGKEPGEPQFREDAELGGCGVDGELGC